MSIDLSGLDNNYVVVALALFLTWYTYMVSNMKLPKGLINLFNNGMFRIAFLALILTLNLNKAPHIAITLILVYVLTILYIHNYDTKENFAYLKAYGDTIRTE